jgi:hypothetical protein
MDSDIASSMDPVGPPRCAGNTLRLVAGRVVRRTGPLMGARARWMADADGSGIALRLPDARPDAAREHRRGTSEIVEPNGRDDTLAVRRREARQHANLHRAPLWDATVWVRSDRPKRSSAQRPRWGPGAPGLSDEMIPALNPRAGGCVQPCGARAADSPGRGSRPFEGGTGRIIWRSAHCTQSRTGRQRG